MPSCNTCGCGCSSSSTSCGCAVPDLPQSVCVTAPCSTSENIASMQSGFCQNPAGGCTPIYPEPTEAELLSERNYTPCTDPNGCTGLFPAECRNTFWPSFAHPRWLCCADLYCVNG